MHTYVCTECMYSLVEIYRMTHARTQQAQSHSQANPRATTISFLHMPPLAIPAWNEGKEAEEETEEESTRWQLIKTNTSLANNLAPALEHPLCDWSYHTSSTALPQPRTRYFFNTSHRSGKKRKWHAKKPYIQKKNQSTPATHHPSRTISRNRLFLRAHQTYRFCCLHPVKCRKKSTPRQWTSSPLSIQ